MDSTDPFATSAAYLACHCAAVRQASRSITQFYDQHLAPSGLRASQFSMLSRLYRQGALGVQALAADMGMDRTTLARNLQPLERDGLLVMGPDPKDRRAKCLDLTPLGRERVLQARELWKTAQAAFEQAYGADRAHQLRDLLQAVKLAPPAAVA